VRLEVEGEGSEAGGRLGPFWVPFPLFSVSATLATLLVREDDSNGWV